MIEEYANGRPVCGGSHKSIALQSVTRRSVTDCERVARDPVAVIDSRAQDCFTALGTSDLAAAGRRTKVQHGWMGCQQEFLFCSDHGALLPGRERARRMPREPSGQDEAF